MSERINERMARLRGVRRILSRFGTSLIEDGPASGFELRRHEASNEYANGRIELPVQECIAGLIRPGNVFYDIGANVGFFSLVAAAGSSRECRIVAFEPRPRAARMLRRNLHANAVDAAVWEVAVGARTEEVDLWVGDHPGGATVVGGLAEQRARPVRVVSIALDDFIDSGRLPTPDVVKIDVEGAEPAVIEGMERTLRSEGPSVVFEVDAPQDREAEARYGEVEMMLTDLGYVCRRLNRSYEDTGWSVLHGCATRLTRDRTSH